MSNTKAVKYEQEIGDIFGALVNVHQVMDAHGFDRKLQHLVVLRASQINGCGFCVKMHTKEARDDGETNEKLDRLVVWKHVSDFSEREQAALAWAEALTELDAKTEYGTLRARLREHFNENEIGVLTAAVGMVNFWNRMQVSRH